MKDQLLDLLTGYLWGSGLDFCLVFAVVAVVAVIVVAISFFNLLFLS